MFFLHSELINCAAMQIPQSFKKEQDQQKEKIMQDKSVETG